MHHSDVFGLPVSNHETLMRFRCGNATHVYPLHLTRVKKE